jgi:hypothetical protein
MAGRGLCLLLFAFPMALLTALVMLVTSTGCSRSENGGKRTSDELSRANFLIDKKQYSEAIYILNSRLERNPQDQKTRVLLASAYSGRAGLSMASFAVFAHEVDKWRQIDELLPVVDDGSWIQTVAKISFRLQVSLRAFDALPILSLPEAVADLDLALKTLDGAGRIFAGMSIFRALVRVVYFKHQLVSQYRPKLLPACKIASGELTTWLTSVSTEVGKIVDDVAYGFSDAGARDRTLKISSDLKINLDVLVRAKDLGLAAAASPASATNNLKIPDSIELPPFLKKVYGECGA